MNHSRIPLQALLSLLWRFSIRYWRHHWIKLSLLIAIVGLGTGSFLAIGLANRAATNSFDRFARAVSGQSQIVLTATVGSLAPADLRLARLALLESEATLVPQTIASCRLVNGGDLPFEETVFTLVGMDLLAASNFLVRHGADRSFWNPAEQDSDSNDPDRNSRIVRRGFYSQAETARTQSWQRDQHVAFYLHDSVEEMPWLGELPQIEGNAEATANVLVTDWQYLAELLDQPLRADRVDIVFAVQDQNPDAINAAVQALDEANPGHWVVESQTQRQQTGQTMTLALRMNLRALSALSLLVAICLVFQAMDSAVARRQREVAVLHSIGVSSNSTRFLWLADSTIIGFLGGGFGLALGAAMAQVSTRLVTQTVNTLYHEAEGAALAFDLREAAIAWGLTLLLCVAAGWWPARQAARAPLVETMRRGGHRSSYSRFPYALATVALVLLSLLALQIPPVEAANGHAIPVGGYALALFLIGLVACVGCLSLEFLGYASRPVGQRFTTLRVALSQFRMPVTRHRLALSGVILSVGMTAAMIFLIGSFEATVRSWISNALQADLFIRSKAVAAMHDPARLSPSLANVLMSDPRVLDGAAVYSSRVRIEGMVTQLGGLDTEYTNQYSRTTWLQRPNDLLELKTGDTAIINEAFASRFDKNVGDPIILETADGPVAFRIIGVYADYGNESGSVGIDAERYRALTGDDQPRGLALHATSVEAIEPLARHIEQQHPGLQVMTNRWLREETLRIFNRVFSITYALVAIGLLISVAGLGSMLASLLIERRPETGALVRIGFSPRQVSMATLWEGASIGLAGVIGGLLLGLLLGLVLVYIINKQSFGWTLSMNIPWQTLVGLAALTLAGAGVVSYFVGRWSANLPLQNDE